jgi:hypothetical protein
MLLASTILLKLNHSDTLQRSQGYKTEACTPCALHIAARALVFLALSSDW